MSEKLHHSNEREHNPATAHERVKHIAREKTAESATDTSVENIRSSVEKHSVSGEKIQTQQLEKQTIQTPITPANSHVKKHALDQTLRQVRRKLPRTERQFSKFIHNPAVEQISSAASETIARPSGLLMGGIVSLLSGLGLLIACYRYGYTYNFLIATAFFAGGFLAGIAIEAIVRIVKR